MKVENSDLLLRLLHKGLLVLLVLTGISAAQVGLFLQGSAVLHAQLLGGPFQFAAGLKQTQAEG